MKNIKILGIESSCDETAASVVENGRIARSNVIATQIPIHKRYGGVVPEIASRNHVVDILPVIEEALTKADCSMDDISAIAVTYGPGLIGPLLVGLNTVKALSYANKIPYLGVNHIKGHIAGNYLSFPELEPPFISLIVSGGHTHIVEVKDYNSFHIVGKTRDDAAGEAYDKVARALGLSYPGGPYVDRLAQEGKITIDFPMGMIKEEHFDFSFSGVKSAVLNYINSCKMKNIEIPVADIAASFQDSVATVLTEKTLRAAKELNYTKVALCGGVSANRGLRAKMAEGCKERGFELYYPELKYCTDNAAMIASAGYYEFLDGKRSKLSLTARPNLKIGDAE